MALGVLFGLIMSNFEFGKDLISDWIKPFGTIFINSLKLIAIPLILASLIKGISDLKDIAKLSKMGGATIVTYMITTVIAVSIGLIGVNVVKPGESISEETRLELISAYESDADEKREVAADTKNSGPLQALVDVVPSNIVSAAGDNSNSKTRKVLAASFFPSGPYLGFRIIATSFLWKMVRIIVGTLLEYADKGIPAIEIKNTLETNDRNNLGQTAPARGLFLERVWYTSEHDSLGMLRAW